MWTGGPEHRDAAGMRVLPCEGNLPLTPVLDVASLLFRKVTINIRQLTVPTTVLPMFVSKHFDRVRGEIGTFQPDPTSDAAELRLSILASGGGRPCKRAPRTSVESR